MRKALEHWTGQNRLSQDDADELMEDNYRFPLVRFFCAQDRLRGSRKREKFAILEQPNPIFHREPDIIELADSMILGKLMPPGVFMADACHSGDHIPLLQ